MWTIRKTAEFAAWLDGLRDVRGRQGKTVIVLLAGGEKTTQSKDIMIAQRLARNL